VSEWVTTRDSNRESVREKPIMARLQRMPSEEAGYTFAVEPVADDRLLANEEESIYRHSDFSHFWILAGSDFVWL
jgi:hypothetical protein